MKSSKRLVALKREWDALERARRHVLARKEVFLFKTHYLIESASASEPAVRRKWLASLNEFVRWKTKLHRIERAQDHLFSLILREKSALRPLTLSQFAEVREVLRRRGTRVGTIQRDGRSVRS